MKYNNLLIPAGTGLAFFCISIGCSIISKSKSKKLIILDNLLEKPKKISFMDDLKKYYLKIILKSIPIGILGILLGYMVGIYIKK